MSNCPYGGYGLIINANETIPNTLYLLKVKIRKRKGINSDNY